MSAKRDLRLSNTFHCTLIASLLIQILEGVNRVYWIRGHRDRRQPGVMFMLLSGRRRGRVEPHKHIAPGPSRIITRMIYCSECVAPWWLISPNFSRITCGSSLLDYRYSFPKKVQNFIWDCENLITTVRKVIDQVLSHRKHLNPFLFKLVILR